MSKLNSICPQCKCEMEELCIGSGIGGTATQIVKMCMNNKCLFFRVSRSIFQEDFE